MWNKLLAPTLDSRYHTLLRPVNLRHALASHWTVGLDVKLKDVPTCERIQPDMFSRSLVLQPALDHDVIGFHYRMSAHDADQFSGLVIDNRQPTLARWPSLCYLLVVA